MIKKIEAAELQHWIDGARAFSLLDVLGEEFYEARHLPGARRASVYEVDFLDQVGALKLEKSAPVVLYGAGEGSLDSSVAAEKLARAGFTLLFDFSGGRAAWEKAGGRFETGAKPEPRAPAPEDRAYEVDREKSVVEWIGRNANSSHRGTIHVASGSVAVRGGTLHAGRLILDMRTIENSDIKEGMMRALLEAHLKSDDFFDVERFPTAALEIISASALDDAAPGSPNCRVNARLTIKDVTHPIEFPAVTAVTEDGALIAIAQLEFDRTRWNVIYGSGRFFKMLGKHLVHDAVMLLVKIVAR